MKVVIAGCGWLGTEVGGRLVARGERVVGVRRSAAAAAELEARGIEPVVLDLAGPGETERLPHDTDAIVACASADSSSARDYERAYLEIPQALLEFAGEARVRRLVYVGSTGVFGQSAGESVDEATPPVALGPTAEILLRAERQLLGAGAGPATCVLRLSGLYGPGRFGIVERVRSGRLALGPGDDAWMNFCHLEDAVRAVLAVLDAGRPGAVYHASDAAPARRREVVGFIAGRLGIPAPRADAADPRVGRGLGRRVAAERTRDELGIALAFPGFREGLGAALPG